MLFALVDFWLTAASAIDFPECLTAMLAGKVVDAVNLSLLRVA
jgi:hypothetical protein